MAKKKSWSVQAGQRFERVSPEDVWDAWVDAETIAAATAEAATGTATVGAKWTALSGGVTGVWLELERPTHVRSSLRTSAYPEEAKDSTVVVTMTPWGDGGTEIELEHFDFQPAKASYETRMWWVERFFLPLRAWFAARGELPAAASPPEGPAAAALLAWAGGASPLTPQAWWERFAALAKTAPPDALRWWKATDPARFGLQLWARGFARFGHAALVRVALAAAETALPVWRVAEESRPDEFDDIADFGPGRGLAPPAQCDAVRAWLAAPGTLQAARVRASVDGTRQLRFSDPDLGDLSVRRWAYALEASYAAALAVDDAGSAETELAVLTALEATSAAAAEPTPPEVGALAEAVRSAVDEWISATRDDSS